MMRSKFAVVVIVLYASAMLAQHSSGGGGGGSSSASSGGGSHSGGYSGGSTSSATSTSHSSGGSGGSSSHSSTSGSAISHSAMHGTQSNPAHFIHTPNVLTETKTPQSEKKGLLSFLRHPFKKPEPRPVNNLRHWLCGKGPCPICPSGQSNGKGACIAPLVATRNQTLCPSGDLWNGGACTLQTHFLDDCSALRMAMARQAQLMQQADHDRQVACTSSATQECSDLTRRYDSEANYYRVLQDRLLQCRIHR